MSIPSKGNLRLVGETTMNGGVFGRVSIIGDSRLIGRTQCDSFSCTGNSQVEGELAAGSMKVIGELIVEGDLKAHTAKLTGEIRVQGSSQGDRLNVTGGMFHVEGNCEYEQILVRGMIVAKGLLSADRIDLRLFGGSTASEIGGGHILVKQSKAMSLKKLFVSHDFGTLRAGTIEGDVIELEHTIADVVRGNRVTIGPGCEIGRVEYRDDLRLSKKAKAAKQVRID
ncbi:hypothetical protein [Cohnella sp. AR92]|uniref:hypothetical protein n=1 Tax=Cohnella sp. AR92 TaxID=648716 RepID=UPI000F8F13E0|nr:hypothetical protein [Cohnella sp. AR92]RUS46115.1 hypothetical protein ELR57_16925 [Cohnella sp. AR92]